MQIYLATTPATLQEAAKYHRTLVHVAYRIGPCSTLLRQNFRPVSQGGLLSVSDAGAPCVEDTAALCAAALRECGRRGYTGVVLDFEEPQRPDLLSFARQLGPLLSASRRTLYLPERYGCAVPQATTLICTAISGGNFTQHLQETMQHGGAYGLDVQRLRMDFCLPCRTGEGTPLSKEEFQHLLERESPAVFFAQDLCARYFTYNRHGDTHFVLFDDAETLRQKVKIGKSLGYTAAFFMWPEVADIAGELFPSL